MTNNLLEIENLNLSLDKFKLTNINLQIEKGTIMGFIGKNGSGKTTLIKTIFDIYKAYTGNILIDNTLITSNEVLAKSKIGVVFDSTIYPLNLKPKKIAKMIEPFYSNFDMDKFHSLMKDFNLDENKNLSTYSKGMLMKFSIILVLCQNPELLILDEPTAGLDPTARVEILDLLLNFIQDENKAIFFSTHITSDLDKIADYITLIDNGKIIFSKSKDELLDTCAVVHIDKGALTKEMKDNISGLKETIFGYEGLCTNINLFNNISDIKIARPSIEDIMVYGGLSNVKENI